MTGTIDAAGQRRRDRRHRAEGGRGARRGRDVVHRSAVLARRSARRPRELQGRPGRARRSARAARSRSCRWRRSRKRCRCCATPAALRVDDERRQHVDRSPPERRHRERRRRGDFSRARAINMARRRTHGIPRVRGYGGSDERVRPAATSDLEHASSVDRRDREPHRSRRVCAASARPRSARS